MRWWSVVLIALGSIVFLHSVVLRACGVVLVALDLQAGMLRLFQRKLARKRYRDAAELITPVQASATARPFVDGAFDALYLVCALHEIQDRDAPLAEFRRVPRPDGLLAVVEFRPDPDYRLRGTTRRVVESRWFSHEVTGGLLWSYTARFR